MKFFRLLLFFTIIAGALAFLCEGIAFLYLYLSQELPPTSYEAFYKKIAATKNDRLPSLTGKWLSRKETGLDDEVRLHPYFGYVRKNGNNYGFDTILDFPYRKKEYEYVIGIFGGSLAAHLASHIKDTPELIRRIGVLPQLKGKKPILFNMSYGGYKQPQQFLIFSSFVEMFDMAIVLDGFNEINALKLYPYYPIESPRSVSKLERSEKLLSGDQIQLLAAVAIKRNLIGKMVNLPLQSIVLKFSSIYFLVFDLVYRRTAISIAVDLATIEQTLLHRKRPFYDVEQVDSGTADRIAVEIWRKYTTAMRAIAQRWNVAIFFFLQPNQHVENSKQLSDEERKTAYDRQLASHYNEMFRLMKAEISLFDRDIDLTDLTMLFSKHEETLYIDPCCHLNPAGLDILAQGIFSAINQ